MFSAACRHGPTVTTRTSVILRRVSLLYGGRYALSAATRWIR